MGRVLTEIWHWGAEWWWQDPQPSTIALCPYGQPGDRLWVKETFWTKVQYCATPINPGKPSEAGEWWPATWNENGPVDDGKKEWVQWQFYSKRPAIFMPRWASRLTLEITGVRVERVQDISNSEARAEGIHPVCIADHNGNAVQPFRYLWDSINAKRGYDWEVNPWVWVIEFKRVAAQEGVGDVQA